MLLRAVSLGLLAAFFVLAGRGIASPPPSKLEDLLLKGSRVRGATKGVLIRDAVKLVESATPNRIAILDAFGRPDRGALSLQLDSDLRDPSFWDVVRAIQDSAGVKIRGVKGNTLELAKETFHVGHEEPAGEAKVIGAFLVLPEVHTFFRKSQVRLIPEPWVSLARVASYQADLVLEDGKRVEFRPRSATVDPDVDRELVLEITPDLPGGKTAVTELALEARLEVYADSKEATSPKLSELTPKSAEIGDAKVRVTRAEKAADGGQLDLRIEVEGARISYRDVSLRDGDGDPLETQYGTSFPVSGSSDAEGTCVELSFAGEGIANLRRPELVLQIPKRKRVELGKLEEIRKKKVTAGLSEIELKSFKRSGDSLELSLSLEGEPLGLGDFVLLSPKGEALESGGSFGSGDEFTLERLVRGLDGDGSDCRLAVEAVTEKAEARVKNPLALVPRSFEAGLVRLRVLSAGKVEATGEEEFRIRLEVDPPAASLESFRLVDKKGRAVEPRSWGTAGGSASFLGFDPKEVGDDLSSLRLRFSAPTKKIDHVLQAKLENVELMVR